MAEALLPGQDLDTILYLQGNLCDERLSLPSPKYTVGLTHELTGISCSDQQRNWVCFSKGQPQCEKEQKARRQRCSCLSRGLGVLVLLHGLLGRVSSGSLLAAPELPLALSTGLSGGLHSTEQRGWKRLGWVCSEAQRQPGNPAPAPGTMLLLVPLFKSHD